MTKKIDIGEKAKVSIVWNVSPLDYTKEKENNIKKAFSDKYNIPISNIIVERNFRKTNVGKDTALNYENIKNITDVSFHHKLYKDYIAENNIEGVDFDEIVKIDSEVNSQINFDKYEKGKQYKIKWLDWSNFLSYGKENHFDFTDLHGLVLLQGEPANKSGKSTFAYDLLHFLFFGQTHSGKAENLGELFNSYLPNETELKVEGCITIEGVDYIIRRTLKRAAKSKKETRTASQKIEYFKVNEVGEMEELIDVENLQEASGRETNKVIKEALGDEKDFDLIISANAKDLDELISLKPTDRGRILSRWIGLSCLEDKNTIAREMWNKKISVNRYCNIYNRETLSAEIEELENINKENEKNVEENTVKVKECEKNIKRYKEDVERYISEKKHIDDTINPNLDLTTLEQKKKTITENGQSDKVTKESLEKEVSEIKDFEYSEEEYKNYLKEKETVVSDIATIKTKILSLRDLNKALKNSEYCPTCKRKFDDVDNTEEINKNLKLEEELKAKGLGLDERRKKLVDLISDIDIRRENNRKKNQIELKISALETRLASQRNEYREVMDLIKKLNDNREAIRFNNELDARINTTKETLKTEEGIRDRLNNEIVEYNKDIESNIAKIKEKHGIIAKITDEEKVEKNWKLYLQLIGKDGISKMVLRDSLPIINAEMNNLLSDVCDFSVEISINDKNEVNFMMERDGVKYRLTAASGLERTLAALALRVVLGNLSRLCVTSFVLFDEILGTVAKENYDSIKKLYDKIVKYYDFILNICHIDLDWYEKTITIKKENNISKIVSVENN